MKKLPRYKVKLVREDRTKYTPVAIKSPECINRFLGHLKNESQEIFVVLFLNARNEVTGYQEISRGTLNSSLVHPREVFKGAILHNANAIIAAHNHPTGDSTPSVEDKQVTEQLIGAGALLGIQLLDHVIIGDNSFSFRDTYPEYWS